MDRPLVLANPLSRFIFRDNFRPRPRSVDGSPQLVNVVRHADDFTRFVGLRLVGGQRPRKQKRGLRVKQPRLNAFLSSDLANSSMVTLLGIEVVVGNVRNN